MSDQIVNTSHKATLEGEYCFIVKNHTTGATRQVGPFHNLITNQGLNSFGGNPSSYSLQYCKVGTGTTPPAFTDTELANPIAYRLQSLTPIGTNDGAPNYSSTVTGTYNFPVGAVTGNITEVGVGTTSGSTPFPFTMMFSRALILDSGGSPVTITVLADESLTVIYTLRMYPPLADSVSVVTDPTTGIEHTLTSRPFNIGTFLLNSNGLIYTPGSSPNDRTSYYTQTSPGTPLDLAAITATTPFTGATLISGSVTTTVTISPYVAGSYSRTVAWTIPLATANSATGIGGFSINSSSSSAGGCVMSTQIKVVPPIMKSASNTLTFNTSISWARRP